MLIIRITGKAKDVFSALAQLCNRNPQMTLKEVADAQQTK